jgi:ribonuclease P protein component
VVASRRGGGQGLPRSRRLTRGSEIQAVFRRGKRSRTSHLDVFDSASPVAHPRAGVIVPRYRQTVVARNRVKRRLREVLRREVLPRLEAAGLFIDVLVRARREAYGAPFAELRQELEQWTDRRLSRAASSS